jgi:para-nitrobenzyl esterase
MIANFLYFHASDYLDALNWTGVRQTYSQAEICPQVKIFDWLYLGNEDCLYMDIYAPAAALEEGADKLPVFVWIYGGAWIFGDGYEFGLSVLRETKGEWARV